MSNDIINRKEARKKAEVNSKHNDMKQHADKLIQGFQKLSESHAKRAIWELFQNAIDLSENAEIVIQHTSSALIFKHNGKPFDDTTLNCLIKQVSSKSAESNDEEIGQYGTGFITTHSFGRRILLSGSLINEGFFISLNKFELDRTPKTSPEMIQKLITQQEAVFDLVENGSYEENQATFTEFAYLTESELQKMYATEAIKSLSVILPYVMILNHRLKKVIVTDIHGSTTVYEKGKEENLGGIIESQIKLNSKEIKLYSIENIEPPITVILPINEKKEAQIMDTILSKLFLFYPLIGTEAFGINFIIHSKNFAPTEQRDGIYLKSKTEQIQQNEEDNRKLLLKASEMIFDFIITNANEIKNPLNLAQINFNVLSDKPLLNEYFSELKTLWREQFKTFPLVETESGNLEPSNAAFFSTDLLLSASAFESIYSLVSRYWKNIPKRNLVSEWTRIIGEWDLDSVKSVSIKELILKIQDDADLKKFENESELLVFYAYLLDNGYGELFNNHKLLPNIKGEFRLLSVLNSNINLQDVLIEISDVLMPDIPKRLIHPNFKFNLELNPYTRKAFANEINAQISAQLKDDTYGKNLQPEFLSELIRYCKLTTSIDSSSVPSKMTKLICRYYNQNEDLIQVASIKEDEMDIRPSQIKLLKLFLNDISKEETSWVVENLEFLAQVIETGDYYEYDSLFKTMNIFPNQLNELTVQSYLQIDEGIPEEIKDLFDKVTKPKLPIRSSLVLDAFADYLKVKEKKSIRALTEKIESVFSSDGQYSNIKDHPFQEDIIFIIHKIMDDDKWGYYFPLLNTKRANVMLDKVSDNQITSDVFSIIRLQPDQINKLGDLSRNKHMDRIIELGIIALDDEQQRNTDFQFKHAIGKHIENLIKDKIGVDLAMFSVDVQDVQNGQDIVISKENRPVYFIEVKSRWDERNSITMSKNQFMNAIEHKDKYALCSVDMTKYKIGDQERYKVEDTTIIFDRIKLVKTIGNSLEPLISGILLKNDIETEITLTGDYKATIPQTIIQGGDDLDKFVNDLIGTLQVP